MTERRCERPFLSGREASQSIAATPWKVLASARTSDDSATAQKVWDIVNKSMIATNPPPVSSLSVNKEVHAVRFTKDAEFVPLLGRIRRDAG